MRRGWLNLALLFATAGSVFFVFWGLWHGGVESEALTDQLWGAGYFTASVLLILGAHEMGHYLMARHHQVDSSLPYFIPIPLGFGTMGAVIRLRGRIPSRNALVDIGAAGPLAGLLIAVPLFAVGVALCTVGDAPPVPEFFPGPMSAWVLVPRLVNLVHGADSGLGGGAQVFGDNLLTLALQRLVVGPLPAGKDLFAHPVLIAAWFGMLVTMLNLMPIGQLDGGHLTHAWFGARAVTLGKVIAAGMLALVVFFSVSWVVWLVLTTKIVGFRHPEVILPEEPLSSGRKVVCAVCFVLFVLTLMPTIIPAVTASAIGFIR